MLGKVTTIWKKVLLVHSWFGNGASGKDICQRLSAFAFVAFAPKLQVSDKIAICDFLFVDPKKGRGKEKIRYLYSIVIFLSLEPRPKLVPLLLLFNKKWENEKNQEEENKIVNGKWNREEFFIFSEQRKK